MPRSRGSALAHGCGRGGRVVLPVATAAAVSTGLRVREALELQHEQRRQRLEADALERANTLRALLAPPGLLAALAGRGLCDIAATYPLAG